ncbi:alcohol dehydrogenase [Leifsonia sp. ALI-44-B]|uniref:alcohol dehydrogenase catalytic domain-containing protein n=1 Tax=Leifsonia sp. ALI-44-B TaxID=1933776 RepID=UPI00097CA513|nr:alcohol dehydrogenase catalytic domain-containing protein [Leifsonia sp. ALI-44-B]ONI61523.1 alcohol dehydrogenase [Leifsonia sp. ALI-44-B]
MRAIVYDRFGTTPEVREVEAPTAPEGGVVIRVAASGLCRSDWHAWAGHDDTVHLPHVPGHEFVGTIEQVGAGVSNWSVGDRVTSPFVCGCGVCEWCLGGNAQVCPNQTQPGFTGWGSHAELVAIHAADTNLVAVPDTISDDAAASLGCRFATAFRAVHARADVQPGEWVAVFGAGGVGLSAIMIASALGARVVAIDRNPDALTLARSVGAEATVVAAASVVAASVVDQVISITDGGAHVALDAVGSASTSTDALLSLRRRGRHVQIGLLSADELPRLPLDRVIGWELDLLGSHGMAAADYAAMLTLVADGTLRPQDLVGGAVTLAEGATLLPLTATAPPTGITVIHPAD